MKVLGVNAVFHDPAAALVVDGSVLAAAEEERFSRREHGKEPVPFSAWELPVEAMRWCLDEAGLAPVDLDVVAYSYDPSLALPPGSEPASGSRLALDSAWEQLRPLYAEHAPHFLAAALPGLQPARVTHIPHHLAHAASAALAAPPDGDGHEGSAVLVADGRGESTSHLAGFYSGAAQPHVLVRQPLPESLGLVFRELARHLGFRPVGDEYKVMALAARGQPTMSAALENRIAYRGDGLITASDVDWPALAPPLSPGGEHTPHHADLAASVQDRVEEVLLALAGWLHEKTGRRRLTMAGEVALNHAANSRLAREGPFEEVWVQPAAGEAGTALGSALQAAADLGEVVEPMPGADLGRSWDEDELAAVLDTAHIVYERPADLTAEVARALSEGALVGWFQGRSEYGPAALGRRSLLADPSRRENLDRISRVRGEREFCPVASLVAAEHAPDIFSGGPLPCPYPLFDHHVAPRWRARIPAVVHPGAKTRAQTVHAEDDPLTWRLIRDFASRTGLPVLAHTELRRAGNPRADSPRDALECFGSAPVDVLALGPYLVRRRRT